MGVAGAIVTSICCVTPVLVLLLGAIGLSALSVYLDFVLFPVLGFFVLLIGYALWIRRRKAVN
ncbi:MAG: mercury resistance system transport protein MerF [Rhodospirillaceae bacterium]|nr:mercury resistance system transport protein MerF [Rhodospirillaceae bacterium]MBT4940309.1 mercury resistance system transport protein MerF [Rhodospirillaceae bacterium]MBT5940195.1 mercury resistance system transport protein MerF [Rhodospirillaceae bacterium]MBT7267416.1 mercury resistance system transport protein MerF [Rhodospirillaceae bacterium]